MTKIKGNQVSKETVIMKYFLNLSKNIASIVFATFGVFVQKKAIEYKSTLFKGNSDFQLNVSLLASSVKCCCF